MNKKPMNKKTAVIVLAVVIAAAVLIGFVFLSMGDGPVMGMVLSDREMKDTGAYSGAEKAHDGGIYLVVSNAFNQYQTDYEAVIPAGGDLYASVHFVECPQGSVFTGKWIKDDDVIAEEDGVLSTGPEGVISYKLDGALVTGGGYMFELYRTGSVIFHYSFSVE